VVKDAYYHAAFRARELGPDANYWYATRHEAGMALNGLAAELCELENSIIDKQQSLAALSGALLQIAKQGISIEHRRPENCPNGRKVFGVDIKWLIWAGRNQAIHYENPKEARFQAGQQKIRSWSISVICSFLKSHLERCAETSKAGLGFVLRRLYGGSPLS
jgi:hypothetical protein